ncbi:hypothetical protein HMI56_000724 [Coelomomyces lativittatus]|nr:hypothetical protein HMI56_000724 [Coelomomyces lativittatus]
MHLRYFYAPLRHPFPHLFRTSSFSKMASPHGPLEVMFKDAVHEPIPDTVDRHSSTFKENELRMKTLVEDLQVKVKSILLGGGEAARLRHLSRGKLLPRARYGLEMCKHTYEPFFFFFFFFSLSLLFFTLV